MESFDWEEADKADLVVKNSYLERLAVFCNESGEIVIVVHDDGAEATVSLNSYEVILLAGLLRSALDASHSTVVELLAREFDPANKDAG